MASLLVFDTEKVSFYGQPSLSHSKMGEEGSWRRQVVSDLIMLRLVFGWSGLSISAGRISVNKEVFGEAPFEFVYDIQKAWFCWVRNWY